MTKEGVSKIFNAKKSSTTQKRFAGKIEAFHQVGLEVFAYFYV